jgi:hypothetical protein
MNDVRQTQTHFIAILLLVNAPIEIIHGLNPELISVHIHAGHGGTAQGRKDRVIETNDRFITRYRQVKGFQRAQNAGGNQIAGGEEGRDLRMLFRSSSARRAPDAYPKS